MRDQRTHPIDVLRAAAGHDRERALLGAGHAARYRRVHQSHSAPGLEPRGVVARRGRRDAREVDHELARRASGSHAIGPEQHLFDGALIGDADHHDFGSLRDLGRRRRRDRAAREQRRELVVRAVPGRQAMAGIEQAKRHRTAHQADADEAESGRCVHAGLTSCHGWWRRRTPNRPGAHISPAPRSAARAAAASRRRGAARVRRRRRAASPFRLRRRS